MHEDQKPISEYTFEETLEALYYSLDAFIKDYRAPTKTGKARARKASRTLEKLLKRYRKLSVAA